MSQLRMFETYLKARFNITSERGVTAVEYALVVTLIAIAIIVGATALGTATNDRFNSTAGTVSH